ncbi:exodeoxyribonuclease VII large subunit [Guyparkeria halophila]|uniref:Exodeoxyribonuclease 7 large subunit n=1 Tax=Guyparkeria halophila TaxID=47960 RepID=A0A6I6D298_9GAMM|nr:exodeoxyribonuclease VII large subunit [Guyparkeria halophila]QGT78335.1 exodeoxyribonuclease VII large subunit [Guyparkeria halophila]
MPFNSGAPGAGATALSVTQINKQAGDLLGQVFGVVEVIGEISEHKRAASGHHYFALKDEHSQLRCAFFRGNAQRCAHPLREGEEVVATGRLGIYTERGAYQLIVQSIAPAGEGRLAAEFERLKQRLLAEGLFAAEHKRPTPTMPRRIAVISSDTGAAIHDVRVTLARRLPLARVTLFPVRVQGAESAGELRQAVSQLTSEAFDVALIVRGGGSLSDLWSFNDEALVRALYDCPVPVISGVGHETDTTLCDLVADRRAATPTGAAELATPITASDMRQGIGRLADRARMRWEARQQTQAQYLDGLSRRLERAGPVERLRLARSRLVGLAAPLRHGIERRIAQGRERTHGLRRRLDGAHPRRQLEALRGRLVEPASRLHQGMVVIGQAERERVARLSRGLLISRERLMPRWRARLDSVRLDPRSFERRLREERTRLAGLSRQLEALGPRQVQKRGYALVETRDGSSGVLVKRASEVSVLAGTHDRLALNLRFADGDVPVEWRKPDSGASSS